MRDDGAAYIPRAEQSRPQARVERECVPRRVNARSVRGDGGAGKKGEHIAEQVGGQRRDAEEGR